MRRPPHAWQLVGGARTQIDGDYGITENARDRTFPRSRFLYQDDDSAAQGVVENINPAVETVFKLLGETGNSSSMVNLNMTIFPVCKSRMTPPISFKIGWAWICLTSWRSVVNFIRRGTEKPLRFCGNVWKANVDMTIISYFFQSFRRIKGERRWRRKDGKFLKWWSRKSIGRNVVFLTYGLALP